MFSSLSSHVDQSIAVLLVSLNVEFHKVVSQSPLGVNPRVPSVIGLALHDVGQRVFTTADSAKTEGRASFGCSLPFSVCFKIKLTNPVT